MTLKAIQPHLKKVLQDYLNTVKNAKKSDLEKPFIPEDNADFIQAIERCFISSYLLGMIHAEEENPDRKINAGDGDIPPVPFAEAIDFLKARVPMTKKYWEKLEQKLRFRAFTVAKLGTAVEIETAKQILISALEKGESYSQTWEIMNDIFGKGELGFKAGYWENVFRTNTQTAYMAGKLQQYEKTPGIVAYQLLVIEDVRTSKICRRLITKAGRGLVLSVDDDFWKTKGFPPYHFQCRSSVRAVFKSQIKAENIKIDHPKHLDRFKLGEGFGGNPLDNGNWWMMTPSQMEQAIRFGILGQFNREENVFADYESVWKGYKRHEGKNGGWYDLYETQPDDWEGGAHPGKPIVDFLVENGYKIKVLPDIQNIPEKYHIEWSNPDILINGFLADIKTVESSIVSRLKSAKKQHVSHVVLKIPDTFTAEEIAEGFQKFKKDYHTYMDILYIYKNQIFHRILQA